MCSSNATALCQFETNFVTIVWLPIRWNFYHYQLHTNISTMCTIRVLDLLQEEKHGTVIFCRFENDIIWLCEFVFVPVETLGLFDIWCNVWMLLLFCITEIKALLFVNNVNKVNKVLYICLWKEHFLLHLLYNFWKYLVHYYTYNMLFVFAYGTGMLKISSNLSEAFQRCVTANVSSPRCIIHQQNAFHISIYVQYAAVIILGCKE